MSPWPRSWWKAPDLFANLLKGPPSSCQVKLQRVFTFTVGGRERSVQAVRLLRQLATTNFVWGSVVGQTNVWAYNKWPWSLHAHAVVEICICRMASGKNQNWPACQRNLVEHCSFSHLGNEVLAVFKEEIKSCFFLCGDSTQILLYNPFVPVPDWVRDSYLLTAEACWTVWHPKFNIHNLSYINVSALAWS